MLSATRSRVKTLWKSKWSAESFGSLHIEEYGPPKPTLLFIPGLTGTTSYWRGHLGQLEEHCHVVLVDPLGFGDSPKPWIRYSIEAHIEAIHHSIGKYAPFTLVGHSMGTLLALAYAARYPQNVDALVLISLPYYGNPKAAARTIRKNSAINRVFLGNMLLAVTLCLITRRLFGWIIPYLPTGLPRSVAADIVKHSWRSFTSSLWEIIYKYDVRPDADVLVERIPILCVHGDQDKIAPLKGVQVLADGRACWQVIVMTGIDHHPLFHANVATLQAIGSILSQNQ